MYYIGFSHREAMALPVWKRKWFIERLMKEMQEAKGADRSASSNTPETRELMGRNRSQIPAKLRRFT